MLIEDKQLVAMLSISGGGGGGEAFSSSSSLSIAKATRATSLSPVDLEFVECIQYIVSNPPSKDPLLVFPRLVLCGLRILPNIAKRLFVISACSSDVERLFSNKAGYWFTLRKYQLSSKLLNGLLVLNAFYTYRKSFLPRVVRDVLRAEKLKRFKLHFETQISIQAGSADSLIHSN